MTQIAKDCPESFWDHLETANDDYKAPIGKLAERNAAPTDNDVLRTRFDDFELDRSANEK